MGAAVGSETRWISLDPNGLSNIAATVTEGNVSSAERCCFDEGAAPAEESRFQNGTEGGTPPMFFKEWESGFESMGCGRAENKSLQVVEKNRLLEVRE